MTQDYIANLLGTWASELNTGSVLLRITLSVVLSAIIGCERSSKRHSAGLRTFIIISLASATAAITEVYLLNMGYASPQITEAIIIGSAIISGYSILFSSKSQIKGLTTSAGLWGCGIIGIAIGMGLYTASLIAYAALLCSLSFFPVIEKYLKDKSNHFEVHLELKSKSDLYNFTTTIRRLGMRIDDIEWNPAYLNSGLSVYTVSFTISSQELKKYKKHSEIIEAANFARTVWCFRFGRCTYFGLSGVVLSDERCVPGLGMIQSFLQLLLRERSIIFNAKQHDHSWHHRDASQGHFLRRLPQPLRCWQQHRESHHDPISGEVRPTGGSEADAG